MIIDGVEKIYSMTLQEYKAAPRSEMQKAFPQEWNDAVLSYLSNACKRPEDVLAKYAVPAAALFYVVQLVLLMKLFNLSRMGLLGMITNNGRSVLSFGALILYYSFVTSELEREDKAEVITPMIDMQALLAIGAACLVLNVKHSARQKLVPRLVILGTIAYTMAQMYYDYEPHVSLVVHSVSAALLFLSIAATRAWHRKTLVAGGIVLCYLLKQRHFLAELYKYAGSCSVSYRFEFNGEGARATQFRPMGTLFIEDIVIGLLSFLA